MGKWRIIPDIPPKSFANNVIDVVGLFSQKILQYLLKFHFYHQIRDFDTAYQILRKNETLIQIGSPLSSKSFLSFLTMIWESFFNKMRKTKKPISRKKNKKTKKNWLIKMIPKKQSTQKSISFIRTQLAKKCVSYEKT